ncbi:MAG: hypothetical protein ACE5JH_11375 [Acidobacteriota bacterium]
MGLAGLAASFLLGSEDPRRLWLSYLVSWLFFLSVALGGLFFVPVQFLSRAAWSVVIRRAAEQVMGTLPVLAALSLPLAFGAREIYPWLSGEAAGDDPIPGSKGAYLNPGFFYLRAAVYLLSWSIAAWWMRRQSLCQDETGDPAATRRLQTASAPILVWFALTVTFATFDWIMSLDPHWFSTIIGVYFFSGCAVAIQAFLVLMVPSIQKGRGPIRNVVTAEHLHDMGKLLFAFTVFWAYIAFSQFLLIWYAAIPEETRWYAERLGEGWIGLTATLALGHFAVPFFLLLPEGAKRRRAPLLGAAVWLLAMHYLDVYWLVVPGLDGDGFRPHLLDLTTMAAVGGLFLGSLGFLLRRHAPVPIADPRLEESLTLDNA